MPARLVHVSLVNNSDFPMRWLDDGRPHGFWQDPFYPSKITDLKKGELAIFRQESGGVMTGVEGRATFRVEVPPIPNTPDESEALAFWWERPYIGVFDRKIIHHLPAHRTEPNYKPYVKYIDHGFHGAANDTLFGALLGAALFPPWTTFGQMANNAAGSHIFWLVEVVNNELRTVLPPPPAGQPLHVAPSVIYTIKDNGDLIWSRHSGHEDGTFKWADGSGMKVGNGWDFRQVFSGGDGIIYAIRKTTIDMMTGRREGGALAWYRHDDWENGGPAWTAPTVAGKRWGEFKHVFHAGEGVIYAIEENGDLLWYRHDGHADGSNKWANGSGKKVGNGWNNFEQVFAGGDGVIYAIQPTDIDMITGQRLGGNLAWYRHDDWKDGGPTWSGPQTAGRRWNQFKQVFYGGGGVIYAVQDTVIDMTTGQRTGGRLLWYRHEGRDDGSDQWSAGSGRAVGVGWNFSEVLSAA
jgi:hypothetical protein